MPDQSSHPPKERADEVTDERARQLLHEIGSSESIRASIAPFAGFVLVSYSDADWRGSPWSALTRSSSDSLLSWLVGWFESREWNVAWAVAVILLGAAGLAIGLLDPG